MSLKTTYIDKRLKRWRHVKHVVCIFALIAVLLVSAVPIVSDNSYSSAATSDGGILITELDPYGEGFTLSNTSSTSIDIKGWYVSDGEGTVTFRQSTVISPDESITYVDKTGTNAFTSRDGCVVFSKASDTAKIDGKFSLSNSGDDLSLYTQGGKLVDAVCYGNFKGYGDLEGWNGSPVKISSGKYLVRTSVNDTDTASDWLAVKFGWSSNWFSPERTYDADVTPFTFPDSKGIPVLDALKSARSTIYISIYLMSSADVSAILMERAMSGVTVRILVDGGLLNGESALAPEYALLKHVDAAGADVYVINNTEKTRYSYLHNKYAVIDGDTVVVTSENWTSGNIGGNGNRGWGVIVESGQYADFMTSVFENDCTTKYGDVTPFSDINTTKYNVQAPVLKDLGTYETQTYSAKVTPVLSPDSSWNAVKWFIENSEDYLYVEQMDLNDALSQTTGDTTISWMSEAADRGVDVRFVLDCSQANGDEHRKYVESINTSTGIKAVAVDGKDSFKLIHNKGLITGSMTWVGSVNWTTNSFLNNRESAVIIQSQEIADFFKGYFIADFGVTLESVQKDGLHFNVKVNPTKEGTFVSLSALGPDGYSYLWELGDGTAARQTATGATLFEAPAPGTYTAKVTLVGTGISETFEYTVTSEQVQTQETQSSWVIYLAAALVLLLGIIVSAIRGKKNARKRGRGSRNASKGRR